MATGNGGGRPPFDAVIAAAVALFLAVVVFFATWLANWLLHR